MEHPSWKHAYCKHCGHAWREHSSGICKVIVSRGVRRIGGRLYEVPIKCSCTEHRPDDAVV